jgi:hypothetical protein
MAPGFPLARQTMAVEDIERYREDSAKYFQHACEVDGMYGHVDDFKYTTKAHIFHSIVDSIFCRKLKAAWVLIDNIIADLFPDADQDGFLQDLMSKVDIDNEESGMNRMLRARVRRDFSFATTEDVRPVL